MTGRAASAPPVWAAQEGSPAFQPLVGEIIADVAVVGAGFAGLTAALELASSGRSVVLLERGKLASAASASSAGHVGPMLYGAKQTPDQVIARLGEEKGSRLNRMVAGSGRWLFDTIDRHSIGCDAQKGYVWAYRSEKSLDRAAALLRRWEDFGGASERIGRDQLSKHISSPRYAGGFFLPDAGFVDPAKLQLGLAEAARRAGAAVHVGTEILQLDRSANGWRLKTPAGTVTAEKVLIAAGVGARSLLPSLAGTIYPVACGIAASGPLPDDGRGLLPEGGPVADLDDPAIFAPAITADGRLLVSFLMNGAQARLGRSSAAATRRLARAFPGATPPPFESFSWGRVQLTPDGLPRIFEAGEGLVAVTGCNGLGLTLSVVAAREAARLIGGEAAGALALPVTPPLRLRGPRAFPALMEKMVIPLINRVGA